MMGDGWSMMFFGPFMMIAGLVVIVVLAILIVKWFLPKSEATASPNSNASDILEERFARGDIDADEFKAKRDLISK
jgi:putative membrane protein